MDNWLTAFRDWWRRRVCKHPLLWFLCLFFAMFVPPILAAWAWENDSVAVIAVYAGSALFFLPGILIAGFEFLRIGTFQMRDKIQREKTQDLITRRNSGFWKWW